MSNIHNLNEEVVYSARSIMLHLLENNVNFSVVSDISTIKIGDLRNIFRFKRPVFCQISTIFKVLLLFKELIAKHKRDRIKQPVYEYLTDYFNRTQLPLYEIEPTHFSKK